jgi:hypothetical protein
VNDSLVVWQVRVSQEQEHFLLNPFGLLYSEVTASSLIKVDMQVKKKANAVRKDFTPFDGRAHATMRLVDFPFLEPHILLFLFLFRYFRAMWSTQEQRTLESTLPVSSYIRPSTLPARTPNVSSTSTIQLASP